MGWPVGAWGGGSWSGGSTGVEVALGEAQTPAGAGVLSLGDRCGGVEVRSSDVMKRLCWEG